MKSFKTRHGKAWAIVTGSTGGIGLEFARQLAGKGYNIIVLGRRQEVLEKVSSELGTSTKSSAGDLRLIEKSPSTKSRLDMSLWTLLLLPLEKRNSQN